MRERFRFYTDPGHGWLAVTRKELDSLGIANKISGYSYVLGGTVYLEEDCDAGEFINAYREKYGKPPVFVEIYDEDTPIRRYGSYKVA